MTFIILLNQGKKRWNVNEHVPLMCQPNIFDNIKQYKEIKHGDDSDGGSREFEKTVKQTSSKNCA